MQGKFLNSCALATDHSPPQEAIDYRSPPQHQKKDVQRNTHSHNVTEQDKGLEKKLTERREQNKHIRSVSKILTYNHRFYLDEFMEGVVMCFLKFFTNVEKVNLATGDHNADQRSVICTKAL